MTQLKPLNSAEQNKHNTLIEFDDKKVALIKRTVAENATNDELQLFIHLCQKTGLDPLAKQIYFQKYLDRRTGKSKISIITAIDGYRLVADRTGKYAGNDDPIFDNETKPTLASVTVYKIVGGIRCPFTASARWDQYYPGEAKGFMWKKMPHLMLGKCAESLALRKAFPAELSGVYTHEEMMQDDDDGNNASGREPSPWPKKQPNQSLKPNVNQSKKPPAKKPDPKEKPRKKSSLTKDQRKEAYDESEKSVELIYRSSKLKDLEGYTCPLPKFFGEMIPNIKVEQVSLYNNWLRDERKNWLENGESLIVWDTEKSRRKVIEWLYCSERYFELLKMQENDVPF